MRTALSYVLWPALLLGAIAGTYAGMQTGQPLLWLNASYFGLAGAMFLLERWMPHDRTWLNDDGQLLPDLGHTLLSKSAVQILVVVPALAGLTQTVDTSGGDWWPAGWPLVAQVMLGLTIAEFGFYWAHRLSHEWVPLWRLHAVHHSVTRLWFVNTGRRHFLDTVVSVVFGLAVGLLAGVPEGIIIWVSAVTAFIGLLTHANIEMRCGMLNYIFNTPCLHRWHHSMDIQEGNRNYGENLMIFDQIFGTFFNPDRAPPSTIGIHEHMPPTLRGQILFPFRKPVIQAAE